TGVNEPQQTAPEARKSQEEEEPMKKPLFSALAARSVGVGSRRRESHRRRRTMAHPTKKDSGQSRDWRPTLRSAGRLFTEPVAPHREGHGGSRGKKTDGGKTRITDNLSWLLRRDPSVDRVCYNSSRIC